MSIEKVREYFRAFGIEDRIMEFDVSSATVPLAAKALGCEEAEIAKSMSFKDGESCLIIVTAGDGKIDNRRFKDTFSMKATMLPGDKTAELVGHAPGGVCPFAVNDGIRVFLDVSLKRFEKVYPACGSSNSAIALTIEELEKYSAFDGWVDVCKGWREDEL
ncbi:MAG: YbaK/EbsC family protein [Clostridia bacterium]|nr:YbaK/EbsC family protein [Clostridia bacterium]